MQNSTLPQDQPVHAKEKHPANGSGRWSVTGEAGKVVYDVLGNHLALIPTLGEPDSVMGTTLKRVRDYARLGEDDLVFGILANLYRTEVEFPSVSGAVIDGEVVEPTLALTSAPRALTSEPANPDRQCHNCGATSGLRLAFGSPLALDYKQYECADGCAS